MHRLFHLTTPAAWQQAEGGPYRPASLASEGFVHCSYANQVERVANLFYRAEPELLLLVIDASRLTSPVRDEDAGGGELFPHVYGSIDREAVVEVRRLARSANGDWAADVA